MDGLKDLSLSAKTDMKKIPINGLELWQFKSLAEQPSIQHFVTDRSSYSSENEFSLSLSSSPDRTMILRNRGVVGIFNGYRRFRIVFSLAGA